MGSLVTEENARSDLGALGVLRSDLEDVARGVLAIVVIWVSRHPPNDGSQMNGTRPTAWDALG